MRIFDDITNFIFIKDEPEKADVIFVPGGSNPEIAERAAELWKGGFAPFVLPSGKYGVKLGRFPGSKTKKDEYPGDFATEWDFLSFVLIKNGVVETAVLKENEASAGGTFDNAFLSRKVTDGLGLDIQTAMICCKSFHARRCLMTYQLAYPKTRLLVCPADIAGKGGADWFTNAAGRSTVMSELRKCGDYFKDEMEKYM